VHPLEKTHEHPRRTTARIVSALASVALTDVLFSAVVSLPDLQTPQTLAVAPTLTNIG
jgi:hypothetical protein